MGWVSLACKSDEKGKMSTCPVFSPHSLRFQIWDHWLKWKVLPHPSYCPDIAPYDYYLFRSMAHGLSDQQFRSYEDIEKWLDSWIASKNEHFYGNGIRALAERWAKVVANDGQYIEWFIYNHFFTIKLHFYQKKIGSLVVYLILKYMPFWKHFSLRKVANLPYSVAKKKFLYDSKKLNNIINRVLWKIRYYFLLNKF